MIRVNDIARICYEACRAYDVAAGNNSQPEWDTATEQQKRDALWKVTVLILNPPKTGTTPDTKDLLFQNIVSTMLDNENILWDSEQEGKLLGSLDGIF